MRLLHPMMTYISEELYQKLPAWEGKSESICIAPYPQADSAHIFADADQFDQMLDIITEIRKVLGKITLPPKSSPPVLVVPPAGDQKAADLIKTYSEFISMLSKVGEVSVLVAGQEVPKGSVSVLTGGFNVHVDVIKFFKADDEIKKLQKTVTEKEKAIETLNKKRADAKYASTPENIKEQDKQKLATYEAELESLRVNVDMFKKML